MRLKIPNKREPKEWQFEIHECRPMVMPERAIPCTYDKFMEIIMTRRFDPYGVEKWEKKELAKHPEQFRPTTHLKDRAPRPTHRGRD